MSYTHYAVTQLVKETADLPIARYVEVAREEQWPYWLDNAPVEEPLYNLGIKLKSAYPDFKFYPSTKGDQKCDTTAICTGFGAGRQINIFQAVYVTMPMCPYVVCSIGHARYQETAVPYECQYMVESRLINNDRYRMSNPNYNRKITKGVSTNLEKAFKNALLHCKPYSAVELASVEYRPLYYKAQHVKDQKSGVIGALMQSISRDVLIQEIHAMNAAGIKFTTPEFIKLAEEADDALQLQRSQTNKRVDATFIHFYQEGDNMVAQYCQAENILSPSSSYIKAIKQDSNVKCKVNEVPEYIVEKVSVLQTLDVGSHVDGVGMKISDEMYWVEK